jgi:hypothetical protein
MSVVVMFGLAVAQALVFATVWALGDFDPILLINVILLVVIAAQQWHLDQWRQIHEDYEDQIRRYQELIATILKEEQP